MGLSLLLLLLFVVIVVVLVVVVVVVVVVVQQKGAPLLLVVVRFSCCSRTGCCSNSCLCVSSHLAAFRCRFHALYMFPSCIHRLSGDRTDISGADTVPHRRVVGVHPPPGMVPPCVSVAHRAK